MIDVTVTENGETLATLSFDDADMFYEIRGMRIRLAGAVIASRGAPIWQRVAHAAVMAANMRPDRD
ncbi:hypothetical protein HNR60_001717 [Rhodopseudomonas rhenobacensis]|uniref:Uncharacterized protein n=1 Tax=Rhodopseudomonas rhenobacensis TaxID=87461 RepID=A0A7W8DYI4_9BRAD|nr:hypothetical protein [Rhodopseudomonas rhenobacensis]MBB5046968.1 hypothetical protein [Rhodopseudomonas rhenobacensis]